MLCFFNFAMSKVVALHLFAFLYWFCKLVHCLFLDYHHSSYCNSNFLFTISNRKKRILLLKYWKNNNLIVHQILFRHIYFECTNIISANCMLDCNMLQSLKPNQILDKQPISDSHQNKLNCD